MLRLFTEIAQSRQVTWSMTGGQDGGSPIEMSCHLSLSLLFFPCPVSNLGKISIIQFHQFFITLIVVIHFLNRRESEEGSTTLNYQTV